MDMTFGVTWAISPVSDYGDRNGACETLDSVFDSNKAFVVLSVTENLQNILPTGGASKQKCCQRNQQKCSKQKAPLSNATQSSSGMSLVPFLPVCMALRFCNGTDQRGKQVTFGFASGDDESDGIQIFSYYGITVFFQAIAFDSSGSLKVRVLLPQTGTLPKC